MTGPTILTRGFCAPILWGVRRGYSLGEIAEGLGVDEATVMRAVELNSGVRFPRPAAIDRARRDPEYLAWARARQGASQTREALHA